MRQIYVRTDVDKEMDEPTNENPNNPNDREDETPMVLTRRSLT
jgi:hypothetical protein